MSQRVPPKLVRIRPICKHSYSAALDRLFLGLLLPLSRPPFAGKSPLLAESLVHSSGGALILALGQGNRPSGGQHDSPADILSELEIHSGGVLFVNLERVARIEPYGKDSRLAILSDGTRLPVSRAGYARLKALLDERPSR